MSGNLIDLWHAFAAWITLDHVFRLSEMFAITVAFGVLREAVASSDLERIFEWSKEIMSRGVSRLRGLIQHRIDSFRDRQRQQSGEPPRLAEFLVGLFAKRRYRNAILRDLAEDFDSNLASGMTPNRAKWRYWAAALNSIGPQALAALKRIGIVGFLFDYARRLMG